MRLWVWTSSTPWRRSQRAIRSTSSGSTPGLGRATRATSMPAARNSAASGPSGGGASDTAVTFQPARSCETARSYATRSWPPRPNDDRTCATWPVIVLLRLDHREALGVALVDAQAAPRQPAPVGLEVVVGGGDADQDHVGQRRAELAGLIELVRDAVARGPDHALGDLRGE